MMLVLVDGIMAGKILWVEFSRLPTVYRLRSIVTRLGSRKQDGVVIFRSCGDGAR